MTRQTTPTKCVIYARFSPKKQSESHSADRQIDRCRDFAAAQGWLVAGAYRDEFISGGSRVRAGLDAAIASMKRGQILLVESVDRLARDLAFGFTVAEELKEARRQLWCVDIGRVDLKDSKSLMLFGVGLLMGHVQRIDGNARTSAAMKHHQTNGRPMGSRPPFGWLNNADSTGLIEDPIQQETLARLLELVDSGLNWSVVARRLDEEARSTQTGSPWSHSVVRNIYQRHAKT